jgi:hypothetical protein
MEARSAVLEAPAAVSTAVTKESPAVFVVRASISLLASSTPTPKHAGSHQPSQLACKTSAS